MSRIAQITAMLEGSPDDPFLHHALALESIKAGDESRARQAFERNRLLAPAYVATYYHLGKLLERGGERNAAIDCYQQGIEAATASRDNHTRSELQAALDDLED